MYKVISFFLILLTISVLDTKAEGAKNKIAILKQKLDTIGNSEKKVELMDDLVIYLLRDGDPDALKYANQSFALSKQIGFKKGEAYTANSIGMIYINGGEYNQALFYLLLSMRISRSIKDWEGYTHSANNIGIIYVSMNNLKKAYWYFNHALNMNRILGLEKETAANLCNIGIVLHRQNKIRESIPYFNEGLKLAVLKKDVYAQSMALDDLASAYIKLNDYSKALAYCNRNIALIEKPNLVSNLLNAYATKGEIYSQLKKYEKARKYFVIAIKLARKHAISEKEAEVSLDLSKLYEALGRPVLALNYYKRYSGLHDSIYNEKNVKQINFMEAVHESAKKDERILSLNMDKEIALAKAAKEHLLTNAIIVIAILVMIMGLILGRNIILKQRVNNKYLNEEKVLIDIQKRKMEGNNARLMHENALAKYEVLKSKINPHFLFNSLSVLSSVIPKGAERAKIFIENFSDFYRKIIETTEVELLCLEGELEIVNTYLYLQQMEFGENLRIEINIPEYTEQWLVPPFSLQMVVENAIKHNEISHVHPLIISITVKKDLVLVRNHIKRKEGVIKSAGTGESNIIERYRLFSAKLPDFKDNGTYYTATLPLLHKQYELIETTTYA
jgi:tetratricopeptide (TPR) repeat protein